MDEAFFFFLFLWGEGGGQEWSIKGKRELANCCLQRVRCASEVKVFQDTPPLSLGPEVMRIITRLPGTFIRR